MEREVGEYVRTKQGVIYKYTEEEREDIMLQDFRLFNDGKIVKHSPNIIDLIEVGDYVNGDYVAVIEKDKDGNITDICYEEENEGQLYSIGDIKSIVTKEQFEKMEYKVEE